MMSFWSCVLTSDSPHCQNGIQDSVPVCSVPSAWRTVLLPTLPEFSKALFEGRRGCVAHMFTFGILQEQTAMSSMEQRIGS
jgi:hypothetical protein